jgi:hypothetical protein
MVMNINEPIPNARRSLPPPTLFLQPFAPLALEPEDELDGERVHFGIVDVSEQFTFE